MRWFDGLLFGALGVVVIGRLGWIIRHFILFDARARRAHSGRGRAFSRALTATFVVLYPDASTDEGARHSGFVAFSSRQVETSLVVGSLALASWAALIGSKDAPASLAPVARPLLLAAAIVLLAGPALFRSGGTCVTAMGRETTTAIGYALLVVALCAVVGALFGAGLAAAAALLALAVAGRDAVEVRSLLQLQSGMVTPPSAAAARGAGPPDAPDPV